jgi:hypothetical protein
MCSIDFIEHIIILIQIDIDDSTRNRIHSLEIDL